MSYHMADHISHAPESQIIGVAAIYCAAIMTLSAKKTVTVNKIYIPVAAHKGVGICRVYDSSAVGAGNVILPNII